MEGEANKRLCKAAHLADEDFVCCGLNTIVFFLQLKLSVEKEKLCTQNSILPTLLWVA
jgi:hypothetical protein